MSLTVAVGKYIRLASIHIDVQPTWVEIVIKVRSHICTRPCRTSLHALRRVE